MPHCGANLQCVDERSLRHDKAPCRLFWEGDRLLHLGWADCVKVARVRPATSVTASSAGATSSSSSAATPEPRRSLEIVASFQTDYLVAVHAVSSSNAPSSTLHVVQDIFCTAKCVLPILLLKICE